MTKPFLLTLATLLLIASPRAQAATHPSSSDSNYMESQSTDDSDVADTDEDEADMDETQSATTQAPAEESDEEAPAPPPAPRENDVVDIRERERAPAPPQAPRPVPPPAMVERAAPADAPRVVEAKPELGGDLRAPSPKVLDENRRGFFQLGVGPAYGAAFVSDSLMYNVVGSYNFNTSDRWTLKGLADLYMGTGSVTSRLYNFGVGAEYYVSELESTSGVPYVAGDAGLGFGRNAEDQTGTALTLGAGAGFRFAVRELNCDINAHYAQLTANVGPSAPAIFALRGSVAF